MADKMQRFTQRARQALQHAQEEAERLGHAAIGGEHLLLGVMLEEDGIGAVALRMLDLTAEKIKQAVEQASSAGERTPFARIDLSAGAKKVLVLAVEEARKMEHHYIGTEHLLLGLVGYKKGTALEVLKELGVSADEVRRQVRMSIQEAPPKPTPAADPLQRMQQLTLRMHRTLGGAADEAQRLGHVTMGTGHLLLALMRDEEGVAGRALRELGLTMEQVQAAVEGIDPGLETGE